MELFRCAMRNIKKSLGFGLTPDDADINQSPDDSKPFLPLAHTIVEMVKKTPDPDLTIIPQIAEEDAEIFRNKYRPRAGRALVVPLDPDTGALNAEA